MEWALAGAVTSLSSKKVAYLHIKRNNNIVGID